jgi:phosphoribosylanthranilate isomerase
VSVLVKICGVRTPEDARAAADAGADLLGLNFAPASPRRIDADAARAIARAVPGRRSSASSDAARDDVARLADDLGLARCSSTATSRLTTAAAGGSRRSRRCASAWATTPRRAPPRTTRRTCCSTASCGPRAAPVRRSSGARRRRAARALIMAGGLRPETVGEVVRRLRPHGVDVASGVESSPGVKDHGQIQEFIRRAKAA